MSERTGRAWRSAAPTMVAVAVIVAVWPAVARLMGNPTLLPSPLEVLRTFGHLIRSGAIFVNSGTSLGRIVLSWLLAPIWSCQRSCRGEVRPTA